MLKRIYNANNYYLVDDIYLYSLQKVSTEYYVFLQEKKIKIPNNPTLLLQQLPLFLAKLWSLNCIFKTMDSSLTEFFNASNKEYLLSESNSETSTPSQSPKKKQKPQK